MTRPHDADDNLLPVASRRRMSEDENGAESGGAGMGKATSGVSRPSVRPSAMDILEGKKMPSGGVGGSGTGTGRDGAGRIWESSVWRWAKRLGIAAGVFAVVAVAGLVFAVRHFEAQLPSIADLKGNYRPPQVTRVLARDGTLLAEIFTERRTVIPIATVPAHVKLAVLAAEDAGFYEHEGLNYFGIVRAFAVNLRSGKTRQGGSTITQQVVK
ncbi:MAG TPA: transglycosylase domain-containing protein, partial [Polyangiaceae bacterium]|nr:transglycosylase domain-containing protein [Polyangiaceae bacterium]